MDNEIEKNMRTLLMRITPRPLLFFDIEVVEHCNLNCKGCASMSPLANKEFLDVEEYRKDVNRLSVIAGGEMHHINILGGEPLLHPQICDFLIITRKAFPIGKICLVTNGILLGKMDDEFWDVCRDADITIAPTEYPIDVDYEFLKKKALCKNVKFQYFGRVNKYGGWVHTTLDLDGSRNENHSFMHCWQANNCTVLDHGRLYPCPVVPNIVHFNEKFEKKLPVSNRDSIDIYQVENLEQIMSFLCSSIPFCRFCNTFKHSECDWERSKRRIEEWI